MGRHVVIFFVASRVFHSFRDQTGLTLKVRKRGIESRVLKGDDVGGEPKVADFRVPEFLTPKKGDTSQDPKTRVSFFS